MKRLTAAALLFVLALSAGAPHAATNPGDPQVETQRTAATRAIYFPFLAVGHGVLLVLKYGIAYPLWFLFKPGYDTIYESSEDPSELDPVEP